MKKRMYDIDIIKVIAITGVLFIHTCSPYLTHSIGSLGFDTALFFASISRGSVPLFLMASGALMLDSKYDFSYKKLFSKNLLRLLIAMFFWSFIYKLLPLFTGSEVFSFALIFEKIKEVLTFNQEFHFYYIHIMIIVYLFLPVTRIIVNKSSEKDLKYLLILWFVFAILYFTFKNYLPTGLKTGIPAQYMINMTYGAIGYGILGYYLKNHCKKNYGLLFIISGFLITFSGTYFKSVKLNAFNGDFFEGMSIGPMLLATGIFIFVTKLKEPKAFMNKIFIKISNASFCIYLVHIIFIKLLTALNFNIYFAPLVIAIPTIVLIYFILSYLTYFILSKIPYVNKYLI